ncbi:hypothetical protein ACWERI_02555 [Streptomyces collinus]
MSAQDIADRARPSATQPVLHDAVLNIPLPRRRSPDVPGDPGLTDSAEGSWLLADLARAGWPGADS